MKKEFTKEYCLSNKGCYDVSKAESLSIMNHEPITYEDIVNSEMPIMDKVYWLVFGCELTSEQQQEVVGRVKEIINYPFPNASPKSTIVTCSKILENAGLSNVEQIKTSIKEYIETWQ